MNDFIETIIDVTVDVAGETAFYKLMHRKRSPLASFLMGLAGAGTAGLLCYAVVSMLIK